MTSLLWLLLACDCWLLAILRVIELERQREAREAAEDRHLRTLARLQIDQRATLNRLATFADRRDWYPPAA